MKKQLIFIHGGESFSKYEDFIAILKSRELDYETFFTEKAHKWKDKLRIELGDFFDIATPSMPNPKNSKYTEWKIWFERIIPFLNDNVILIGHSQGAMFLTKYLSENIFPKKIQALFLISGVFDRDGLIGEDGGDFILTDANKLKNIEKQCTDIFIYHSKDDTIVPFIHGEKLSASMPSADFIKFEDRGHFLQEEFPELMKNIKKYA